MRLPNLAAAAALLALTSCSIGSGCKNTEVESTRSPDGKTVASVTVVNCGATADFFSYVSIKTDQVTIRDDGMLFAYRGRPDLRTSWKGAKTLQINCNKCPEEKIYRQVVKEGEYRIEYIGFTSN